MAVRQPSPAELERRRVAAAAKLSASDEAITHAVMAMQTGQDWADFLTFAAGFRHFSFNNALLIQLQRPDATYVAGYHQWNTLGRQVRRGETGISVIAADLIHGDPASTTAILQPRNATVFDINQVEPIDPARPAIKLLRPPVLSGARLLPQLRDQLERQLTARGYTVTTSPADTADHHRAAGKHQTVTIRGADTELHTVAALAGELARAVLHYDRATNPPTPETIRTVQTASAAHVILTAQGVDTRALPPLPHPAAWAGPIAGSDVDAYVCLVRDVGNHAISAARTVLDRIEPAPTATLEQVQQLQARAEQTAAAAATIPAVARRARPPRPPAQTVTAPRAQTVERLAPVTAATLAYFLDFGRAEIAQQYLTGRGVTLPDGYVAGYAPVGGGLVPWLKSHGFDEQLQVEAGVARIGKDDRAVDVFRDRIVFPICDGPTLVGFTGRTARDSEIKYLNTPAVELFDKGRLLYGLSEQAEQLHAGHTPVLVEGPMDALAIAQYPSTLVPIAAMGTAFTDRHVAAIAAAAADKRIIVALDDDEPGRQAAVRAGEKLAAQGWLVRVPRPINGKDPADIATEHGAKVIDWLDPRRCRPLIYLAAEQHIAQRGPLEWIETRLQAARSTWANLRTHFPSDPNLRNAINHAADLCSIGRPEPEEPPPQPFTTTHDRSPGHRSPTTVAAVHTR